MNIWFERVAGKQDLVMKDFSFRQELASSS